MVTITIMLQVFPRHKRAQIQLCWLGSTKKLECMPNLRHAGALGATK